MKERLYPRLDSAHDWHSLVVRFPVLILIQENEVEALLPCLVSPLTGGHPPYIRPLSFNTISPRPVFFSDAGPRALETNRITVLKVSGPTGHSAQSRRNERALSRIFADLLIGTLGT